MKKIISAFLFVGGINFIFPSFVQAISDPDAHLRLHLAQIRLAQSPQSQLAQSQLAQSQLAQSQLAQSQLAQSLFATGTASGQEPVQGPQGASIPPVGMDQINQIFYDLDVLRTDPHAQDRRVLPMAITLRRAFRDQYPQLPLLLYEEAQKSFLAAAKHAGIIPAGSHGAGSRFIDLFNRRFNAIPQGPLLDATKQILPVCVSLAEIVGDPGMRALVDQSVQQEGPDSALYGAFLMYASSTLGSLMEESMRAQNAAAEAAAASSSYPSFRGVGGAKISSSPSPDIPLLSEALSTDAMPAINQIFLSQTDRMQEFNRIFLGQPSSDGQKVSLNSSTVSEEIYRLQRFIKMCGIPYEREVIKGLKVALDPDEDFVVTLSGKKLLQAGSGCRRL